MIALRRVSYGGIKHPLPALQRDGVAGLVTHEKTKAVIAYAIQTVDVGPKAVSKIRSKMAEEDEIISLGGDG